MRLIREQLRAVLRQVATVADRGVRHVRALHSFPQSSVEQDIIQGVLAREVLTCHRPLPVRGVMHRVGIHPRDLDAVPRVAGGSGKSVWRSASVTIALYVQGRRLDLASNASTIS